MKALQYVQDLISFESTSNLSNVLIIDYLEDVLTRIGFFTERVEYEDAAGVYKANLIGKKGPGIGGISYFGHTDVVPADTWSINEHGPFQPTIKDGKLFGRGSCDMKASIACMLEAAERFSVSDLKEPIYITCTADEEVGYVGASQVVRQSKLFREMVEGESRGLIGEPTMLEIVYAHKGTYGFKATSRGRASHSSGNQGLNANLAMIPYLNEMKKIYDETVSNPIWQSSEFHPPGISWNIGINDQTRAVNITPPQSICTVYFRPMPGQDADSLIDRAQLAAEKCGIDFEILWRGQPLYVDPNSSFVQEALNLLGQKRPRTVSYGTDGAMFTDMKKLLLFGPGNVAQAHTDDEWIELDQVEKGTDMFTMLTRAWCF